MFRKYWLMVGLLLVLVTAGRVWAANPYAYSLHYKYKTKEYEFVKIDVASDEVIARLRAHEMNNNLTVDQNGDVYISRHRSVDTLGQQVDKYLVSKNKIVKVAKTRGVGPMTIIPYKNRLFVLMYCKADAYGKRRAAAVEVLRKVWGNKYIFEKEIVLGVGTYAYSDHMVVDKENKKMYVAAYRLLPLEEEHRTFIYEIDLEKACLVKEGELEEVGGPSGLALSKDGKLYVTTTRWSYGHYQPKNKDILIYSAKDFSFIGKIRTQFMAKPLVYVPTVNKLYVLFERWSNVKPGLWVIDCAADKVIKKIPLETYNKMSYVGQKKLYISTNNRERGVLVVDVVTDEIVNNIPGGLMPISLDMSDL